MRALLMLPLVLMLAGCIETKVERGVLPDSSSADLKDLDGLISIAVIRDYQRQYGITRPFSVLRGETTDPVPVPIRWGTPYDAVCLKIHRTSMLSNEPATDYRWVEVRREGTRTRIKLNSSFFQASQCGSAPYRPMRHLESVARSNNFGPK